uniref:DNA-directed DNA polymerase n=1 Tax=Globodera rostochiensis TaxID=31243 RepID=A0A914HVI7_GLORO
MLPSSLPFVRSFSLGLLSRSATSFAGLTSEQFMKNPANEPVLEYRKGSAESVALEQELQKLWAEPVEVPLCIGTEKIFRKEQKKKIFHTEQRKKIFHTEQRKNIFHTEQRKNIFHTEQRKNIFHKEQRSIKQPMAKSGQDVKTNAAKSSKFEPKNIQLVSRRLHKHLFGKATYANSSAKEDSIEARLELPSLHVSGNLMEHFRVEASAQFEGYQKLLESVLWTKERNRIPRRPKEWSVQPGWTAYDPIGWNAVPRPVPFPAEDLLFFDVEVCMKDGRLPTLAVALSHTKWYSWCSTRMADADNELPEFVRPEHLISMGNLGQRKRLVIGHNVAFDRTFISEQYAIHETALRFWDTMSMHIAIGGMADHQRDLFTKNNNYPSLAKLLFSKPGQSDGPEIAMEALTKEQTTHLKEFNKIVRVWKKRTCRNSLDALHEKYCNKEKPLVVRKFEEKDGKMEQNLSEESANVKHSAKEQVEWDKKYQSFFKTASIEQIRSNAQVRLFSIIVPAIFKYRFPHPVTYCGMLEMGNPYLPITSNWRTFFAKCEDESSNLKDVTANKFVKSARNLIEELDVESEHGIRKFELDPWMWVSDWNRKLLRPQWPLWYSGLFMHFQDAEIHIDLLTGDRIKMQTREIPRIFGLCYGRYPLFYKSNYGWGFLVPNANCSDDLPKDEKVLLRRNEYVNFPVREIHELIRRNKSRNVPKIPFYAMKPVSTSGKARNMGTPFDKSNYKNFEEGVLYPTRYGEVLKDFLVSKSVTRFWGNYRDRYREELPVWLDEKMQMGALVPSVIPSGTVTRRATHKLWLTSTNPKENVVGSDMKSMVQCADGWKFVGADVDSQEQWLAALFGDSFHESLRAGATPFSNMLLAGNKNDGTDLHSVVGKEVGITRNQAKTLNYARLYGSGIFHAQQYMINQGITKPQARQRAKKMFETTKGQPVRYLKMSESGGKMLDEFLALNSNLRQLVKHNFTLLRLGGKHFLRIDCPVPFVNKFERWLLSRQKENNIEMSINRMRNILYEGDVFLNVGGYESQTFNWLSLNSCQRHPITPVLKCRLSQALEPILPAMVKDVQSVNLDKFNSLFKRSVANWFVQSSAVDFLHLLLVCMRWLCRKYDIPARYVISIHDEVRYLVPEKDRYRCALALTLSNMYVRAAISDTLGIRELPKSIAFFSQVDIDSVLRKEVDLECRAPDTKTIENGEAVNIEQIVKITGGRLA